MKNRDFINDNPNRPYISAELLDKLLDFVIESSTVDRLTKCTRKEAKAHMEGIDTDIISGMFSIMHTDGLMSRYTSNVHTFNMVLEGHALMHQKQGGYTAREEVVAKKPRLVGKTNQSLRQKRSSQNTPRLQYAGFQYKKRL